MPMKKYLIIGNGVAGTSGAEAIRKNDADSEISVVTDEDLPFYYRIRLPDYLGGKVAEAELVARKKEWYDQRRISLTLNTRITGADPNAKAVITANGETLAYDSLLLANGSHPFIPPIKGSGLDGVFTMHSVHDARQISRATKKINRVVIIGGGLLGLEIADALLRHGKHITVVEFFPRLLPLQLDDQGAARLQLFFENRGISLRLGVVAEEIAGTAGAQEVILKNGEVLPAGMVVIAAGVRPNLEPAEMLGLETSRGVIVDSYLQTSSPEIYAAGDVIEHEGRTFGIWPAAMEQGKIAGINVTGGRETYNGTTLSNILKVAGIDLASCGEIDEAHTYDSKIVTTEDVYKKVVIDNRRIIGCIMLGDRKNFNRIHQAINSGEDILDELDSLLQS